VPQIELDPASAVAGNGTFSKKTLPHSARRFGLVPDINQLLPGDLILMRYALPGCTNRIISHAQYRAGFDPDDSRWTHAAIYLYDDFLVEAVPMRGIRTRTLYLDVPHRIYRVRRNSRLSDIERYKIALRALRLIGSRYSHLSAIKMGWSMLNGLWNENAARRLDTVVICSNAFSDAYADTTKSVLHNCPVGESVLPAHLSFTDDLEDIDPGWVAFVSSTSSLSRQEFFSAIPIEGINGGRERGHRNPSQNC
jgi:hypothetical protein